MAGRAGKWAIGLVIFVTVVCTGASSAEPAPHFDRTKPDSQFRSVNLAVADLNDDGVADIAGCMYFNLYISSGDGRGGFSPQQRLRIGDDCGDVVAKDLNGDGTPELVATLIHSENLLVLKQVADGDYEEFARVPFDGTVTGLDVGDFDGSGTVDAVVTAKRPNLARVYPGVGDGSFRDPVSVKVEGSPRDVAAGDLGEDDSEDFVVASPGGHVTLVLGSREARFTPTESRSFGRTAASVATGNLNGGGADEVAVQTDQNVVLLEKEWAGVLQPFQRVPGERFGFIPRDISIDDLDSDGYADVVAAYAFGVYIYAADKRGGISSPEIYSSARLTGGGGYQSVTTLGFADVDSDGLRDVLTAGAGLLQVYLQRRNFHTCKGVEANAVGSQFIDNFVNGAEFSLVVAAGAADDFIGGNPRRDLICTDAGRDGVDAQGGDDRIYGGLGDDGFSQQGNQFRGGPGDDVLVGGPGNDGIGDQRHSTEPGADVLVGGLGNDELRGGPGDDVLSGGRGRDVCIGGVGFDTAVDCEIVEAETDSESRQRRG
jgi:Ca2+-binding RTX toxin-like protein